MEVVDYLLGKKSGGGGSDVKVQSNKNATITENTTTEINPDTGYDALGKVSVTTNVQPDLETKSVTITENTTTTITPTSGKDGISSVEVVTNVPQGITPTGTISITENGLVDVTNYANADVNVSGGGGGGYSGNDVVFYDYDGTIVDSYSKADFLQLTDMPTNPSHIGLTAQGWNWTLSDAKAHVQEYDKLVIGQQYITNDGKTRIYITLLEGATSPYLSFIVNGEITIDWGDGNTETVTGTGQSWNPTKIQHEYSQSGDYIIALSSENIITLTGNSSNEISHTIYNNNDSETLGAIYLNAVTKVEIGNNILLDVCAFAKCKNLGSITIPNTISTIGSKAFAYCSTLQMAVIPQAITSIPQSLFKECRSLTTVSLPKGITELGAGTFNVCHSLRNVTLANSLTTLGNNVFKSNYSLKEIIMPKNISSMGLSSFDSCYSLSDIVFSEGMTTIGGNTSYSGCSSLKKIKIPNTVQSIGTNLFQNSTSLSSVEFGEGCTSAGQSAFYYCTALRKIKFPSTFTTIGYACFQGCFSLASVEFPASVNSIGDYGFASCESVKYYDFSNHTSIPTLGGNTTFGNIRNDCKIIVPDDLYEDWKTTGNWTNYASYIIKASDWQNS